MLPKDFKMSPPTSFSEMGKIVDYDVNNESTITYGNGQKYPKKAGQTYVDIKIQVMSGEDKGSVFIQSNINTGVYKGKNGKSQMYVFLQMIGVKEGILDSLATSGNNDFNLMNTIGKEFDGVKKSREEKLYLDLRDPEFIEKKEKPDIETGIFSNNDEVSIPEQEVEAVGSVNSSSIFDE